MLTLDVASWRDAMMQVAKKAFSAISKGVGFLTRQPHDWKITATRTSLFRFLHQMVLPYLSVYIRGLGASGTQLGIVNSIGMGVAGSVAPFIGWLIDRIGVKRIYLFSIGLLIISFFIYGVAQSWPIIIVAMIAYWLGFGVSVHGCSVICGNCLSSEERVTGMSLCETFAAGALGIIAPIVGALLVTSFGGVNVSGIRPLFFVGLAGTIGTFFLILTQLSNRRWGSVGEASLGFYEGLSQVFKQGQNLKRWLIVASISGLPMAMIIPFTQPFAHEVKGADQYILGAMVAGFAITPLVLGIPIGRLADKIGRKKVLYLTIPLVWASSLVLIWAPSLGFLIGAGILQGFIEISRMVILAMTYELVPKEQMGRWLGIVQFFRLLLSAGAVYLAGIIWDSIGPQYVFLAVIGLDLLIRIPLLIGMPETRWRQHLS